MTKLISYFIFFIIFTTNYFSEVIKPNKKIKPDQVVEIQLKGLINNDNPYTDIGIEQTWEFAHPNNRVFTGPLEKFKQMIYSDNYKILISHENNETIILKETSSKFIYKVYVLSKDKKKYYYIWQIEKVEQEGKLKNCWMTTVVSDPIYLGETI